MTHRNSNAFLLVTRELIFSVLALALIPSAFATRLEDAIAEVQSFSGGTRSSFRSSGYQNALGLDFELQYPSSWRVTKGTTSPSVAVLDSSHKEGMICNIQIKRLSETIGELAGPTSASEIRAQLMRASPSDVEGIANEIFTIDEERTIFQEQSARPISQFSFERIEIDGWPAVVSAAMIMRYNEYRHLMNYSMLYKDYCVYLLFIVGQGATEQYGDFLKRCAVYMPLAFSIVSSITFQPHNLKKNTNPTTKKSSVPSGSPSARTTTVPPPNNSSNSQEGRSVVRVLKPLTSNLYLCKQEADYLVVDFSAYSKNGYPIQRGKQISGRFEPKEQGTIKTEVNGTEVTLSLLKWLAN